MFKRYEREEYRPCSACGIEHKIFDRNKWLCKKCAIERKKRKIDRKTAQLGDNDLQIVFFNIWQEREHKCYHCGRRLGNEPKAIYFSHILSRGAHPKLRCEPKNIVLACPKCHRIYDFGDRNQLERQVPEELIEELLKIERDE